MGKFFGAVVAIIVVALIVGGLVLAFKDIPPPSKPIEKVISNDRLPK